MEYDRGNSFTSNFESNGILFGTTMNMDPNRILFGSKSKEKLSPRSYFSQFVNLYFSVFVGTIDKKHTRYVLTLFTFQSGTLMCTAHVYGPYNTLLILFDV